MAIIPIHTRRHPPADLAALLLCLPVGFADDGLSGFPDSILGWDIRAAGRGHDGAYCTRAWPPGQMDRNHREHFDYKLGEWVRALLPWPLRWTGYAVFAAVYEVGGMKAFDSCGPHPYGANAGQMAHGLCRHNVPKPAWMTNG